MNHTPFTFDTRFDDPSARRDRDPTRPVHSEETLRAAVSAALEEGRQAGIVEAADQTESLAVVVLERVAGELAAMGEREAALRRDAEQAACRLAAQFLKRFAPEYARRQGMDEIEAVLRDCLVDLREEPRIVLRVAEQR
ncbi:MAG: hypothetical protein HOK81_04455, partial [Rhodospirillaceae bacterium]|nr:hypothetical protein [Rhodospirillaceae bacterium]